MQLKCALVVGILVGIAVRNRAQTAGGSALGRGLIATVGPRCAVRTLPSLNVPVLVAETAKSGLQ